MTYIVSKEKYPWVDFKNHITQLGDFSYRSKLFFFFKLILKRGRERERNERNINVMMWERNINCNLGICPDWEANTPPFWCLGQLKQPSHISSKLFNWGKYDGLYSGHTSRKFEHHNVNAKMVKIILIIFHVKNQLILHCIRSRKSYIHTCVIYSTLSSTHWNCYWRDFWNDVFLSSMGN